MCFHDLSPFERHLIHLFESVSVVPLEEVRDWVVEKEDVADGHEARDHALPGKNHKHQLRGIQGILAIMIPQNTENVRQNEIASDTMCTGLTVMGSAMVT